LTKEVKKSIKGGKRTGSANAGGKEMSKRERLSGPLSWGGKSLREKSPKLQSLLIRARSDYFGDYFASGTGSSKQSGAKGTNITAKKTEE